MARDKIFILTLSGIYGLPQLTATYYFCKPTKYIFLKGLNILFQYELCSLQVIISNPIKCVILNWSSVMRKGWLTFPRSRL